MIRQLLTESVLLASVGATLGAALAAWGVRLLSRLPVTGIPRIEEVTINSSVFVFTAIVGLLTGILFGLAPAWRTQKLGLEIALREGQRGSASAASRRLNNALITSQVALSVILLIGAGLLLKSFQHLLAVNPGFKTENVLTARLSLPRQKYPTPAQAAEFYQSLLIRVRALPGITAAGINSNAPFTGIDRTDTYIVEGQEQQTGLVPIAQVRSISPEFFRAMGMPLQRGRDFSDADSDASMPVAIVDETLAHQYWPDDDPIGKRIRFNETTANNVPPPWITIIGVVPDVKHASLAETPEPYIYLPQTQLAQLSTYLVIHTVGDPVAAAPAIRSTVRELDPKLPVHLVRTMTDLVGQTLDSRRLVNSLLTVFAFLAMALAAVGVYGVMSVNVSNRVNEFGIRLALGAQPGDLLRSVLRQGLSLTFAGVVLGTIGALALARLIASLLFEVSTSDPIVYLVVPLLLVAAGLMACYLPARRATMVDVMEALRNE